MKPQVGDLVKIDKDYPNTNVRGQLGVVVMTMGMGIECAVQPVLARSDLPGAPWWVPRSFLEVLSASR
jgi:hypothetical protein